MIQQGPCCRPVVCVPLFHYAVQTCETFCAHRTAYRRTCNGFRGALLSGLSPERGLLLLTQVLNGPLHRRIFGIPLTPLTAKVLYGPLYPAAGNPAGTEAATVHRHCTSPRCCYSVSPCIGVTALRQCCSNSCVSLHHPNLWWQGCQGSYTGSIKCVQHVCSAFVIPFIPFLSL